MFEDKLYERYAQLDVLNKVQRIYYHNEKLSYEELSGKEILLRPINNGIGMGYFDSPSYFKGQDLEEQDLKKLEEINNIYLQILLEIKKIVKMSINPIKEVCNDICDLNNKIINQDVINDSVNSSAVAQVFLDVSNQ